MSDFYDYENDPTPGDRDGYDDFYLKLRRTVEAYIGRHSKSGIAEMLLYVPDFFYLLTKLATDPQVPRANKAQIVAALAYFLSPLDIVPDVIPGLGLLDDLYLAMIVTDNLMNAVDIDIVRKYWPGDEDIVNLIKLTLDRLNDKLGMGAISRLMAKLKNTDAAPPEDDFNNNFDSYTEDK